MRFPWDEDYKESPRMQNVKMTKELKDKMIREMEANKELLIKNHII